MFSRSVSPNEWLYIACDKLYPPFCIQMVLETEGKLNHERFLSAVAQASSQNPGSRLQLHRGRWVDSGACPPVHFIGRINVDTRELNRTPAFTRPLQISTGPTTEVLVCGESNPTIIFRASHSVMDARGLLFWVEEIFRAYRSEKLLGQPSHLTDIDLLRSIPSCAKPPHLDFKCSSPTGPARGIVSGTQWERISAARPVGSTPSILGAGIARMSGERRVSTTRFMIPVDLRRRDGELRSTANLSNPLILEVSADVGRGDVHKDIMERLSSRAEVWISPWSWLIGQSPTGWTAGVVRALQNWQLANNKFLFSAVLSHIGRTSLEYFSVEGLSARSLLVLCSSCRLILPELP